MNHMEKYPHIIIWIKQSIKQVYSIILFVNKINKQYLGEKGKKKGQKDIGYTPKF